MIKLQGFQQIHNFGGALGGWNSFFFIIYNLWNSMKTNKMLKK